LLPAYDLSFYEFDEENDPKSYGILLCDVWHSLCGWLFGGHGEN